MKERKRKEIKKKENKKKENKALHEERETNMNMYRSP